ncbi:unnamed protein product [Calypogeia fissa]
MVHQCCRPAICTHSLGRHYAGHDLKTKLQAAAAHGFSGIELIFEDLNALASRLRSRSDHEKALEKAKLWFQLAHALGTDLILISSSMLPASECTSDLPTIIRDMTQLADLAREQDPKPIRLAYENLAWGTRIDTWEGVHAVVSAVNRWNFGYCFDTFNISGRWYGDPASDNGKTADGEMVLADSLKKMVESVDVEKILLIQVADAERVPPPISPEQNEQTGQPTRMNWSRNARVFAFEEERGGYLPILDVCKAFFDGLGYRGWVSFEVFSRTLEETGPRVVEEHATRAERSWGKLVEAFPQIAAKPQ